LVLHWFEGHTDVDVEEHHEVNDGIQCGDDPFRDGQEDVECRFLVDDGRLVVVQ